MPEVLSPLGTLPPLQGVRLQHLQNLVVLPEAESTNDVARRYVERALAEYEEILPTAIVTRNQTRGRGRAGRTWVTPGGKGLAVSLVLAWPEGPGRVRVPMRWGIAAAQGLSRAFGLDVRLKWPNDLLVGRRKLGGLLVEARAVNEEGYAVVGIGLNVTATREDLSGLPEATSLLVEGAAPELLAGDAPAVALLRVLDDALAEEPEELSAPFARVTVHQPGEMLRVSDAGRTVEGAYAGVTEEGFLKLDTPSGEKVVVSGDVERF